MSPQNTIDEKKKNPQYFSVMNYTANQTFQQKTFFEMNCVNDYPHTKKTSKSREIKKNEVILTN